MAGPSASSAGAGRAVATWEVPATDAGPDRSANTLQLTHDLRETYERYRSSSLPRERNLAYRAWSACFPAFMSASGGMMPLASVAANLPANDPAAARRAEALRQLWARCKGFADIPHDKLLAETQRQRDAWMTGQAHSPGESAAQAHMHGDSREGLRIARDAVASLDPYAIESLKDFVVHYWWDWNDRNPDKAVDRPDLRALAFGVVACNIGLECGPASLSAIQQCASAGACTGDAVDRIMQTLPAQSDRDALLQMSRQVEKAILARDFQALGLQAP